jgi:hypothetical protein
VMPETIGYSRNDKIRRKLSKDMAEKFQVAKDRLRLGMDYRSATREGAWREVYNQYMNNIGWDRGDDDTADIVSVNISFSTISTLVPFIADEAPRFNVEPYSGDASADSAAILTSILNRMWESDEILGQHHLTDAAFDYLLYGDGYVKVGYRIYEDLQYSETGDVVKGRGIDKAKFLVSRVSPWDIWIDPYSDGVYNARWVCQRVLIPKRELVGDDRYKILDNDEVSPGVVAMDNTYAPEDADRIDYFTGDDEWVAVYEYYDTVDNWMMSFVLDGPEWPVRYAVNVKCPIVQIDNYRIPNSPYHIGELENVRSLQEELNKTRSQMVTHKRRNIMKWLVRTDHLSDEAMDAVKSSRINDIIPIEGNDPFERSIMAVTPTPIDTSTYALDAQIQADINEITGVNDYLRGGGGVKRTATEASIIEGATNVRTRHKLLDIESGARHIGQLLLDIMADVVPLTDFEELTLLVTGREAEKLNLLLGASEIKTDVQATPTPETFVGKYVVFVERGSTELRNPQLRAQKMKEMVQIMLGATPILMQLQVPFNIKPLLELWFEAEGIKDVDALFEPDNSQQMMQQLMLQQQMAQGQPSPQGDPRGNNGQGDQGLGNRTQSGQARPSAAQPPSAPISAANSGQYGPG